MSFKLQGASIVAVAATLLAALISAQGAGAIAPDSDPAQIPTGPTPQIISQPVVQPLSDTDAGSITPDEPSTMPASLAEMVDAQPQVATLSDDMRCLAGAIYFEAKSETLPGQLAVGRVVVNRAKSGRFPASYCGVVYQPSQFSFVRGRSMPAINTGSRDWREAVAIAQIADSGAWKSPVEGALFFHASHVSPRWRLTRIAQVDNHIFYR